MQCELCGRSVKSEGGRLCNYHEEASTALRHGYEAWNAGYSGMSWKEYLNRVKNLADTGQWIKEVIVMEERSAHD